MKTIESALSLSSPAINAAKTTVALSESLATPALTSIDHDWDDVQDQLIDLGPKHSDPEERLDEDGYMLPSGQAIASASNLARQLRKNGAVAPTHVIQDAIGGVVFEWKSGQCVDRLTVNRRGEMEVVGFRNSALVYRAYLASERR
ncbi:MAG TPA: hypothetical protein VNH11_21250 [Pirellulales bacterium]|nr:hypothetical protein [Pirellulales bacterium]